MLTATEFVSRYNAPIAGPLPRTTSKRELGEIVVFIDHRIEAASILEFAALLAEGYGARLISVFVRRRKHSRAARAFKE